MNEQKKKYTIMKITLAYIFFFGDDQLRKLIMLQKLKSDTIRKGDNWLKKRLKIMILTFFSACIDPLTALFCYKFSHSVFR